MKIYFPFAVDCEDRESSQCSLCAELEQSLPIDVLHSPVYDQKVNILGCWEDSVIKTALLDQYLLIVLH